jgi:cardiolipin synthase
MPAYNEAAQSALFIAHLVLAALATVHILFHKPQPISAVSWIVTVWALPFAGLFLYWYFGFNRLVEKARRAARPGLSPAGKDPLDRLGHSLTQLPLRSPCRVELLENASSAYPAMIASIAGARRSVDLLTYIFDLDPVGLSFVKILCESARRGVRVRVLVDGIGGWVPGNRLKKQLNAAGVQFASFWRTDHLLHQPMLNLRNHRKLLVVDGAVAYTGGLNISERHFKGPLAIHPLRALRPKPVKGDRDLHFRIRGAALPDLAEAFEADWAGPARPPARPQGRGRRGGGDQVRVVRSGPDKQYERIYEMLLGAMRLAKKSVDLCSPYFIPDAPVLTSMRLLALSGVKVRLFVPHVSDHSFMTWASRAYFRELIEAGVEVWEIEGGFVHSKACVIDGNWCLVGSCNLDPRSFRLNFELNIEVRSRRLARDITRALDVYRGQSTPVDMAFLQRQGFVARLRNNTVKLLSPYL